MKSRFLVGIVAAIGVVAAAALAVALLGGNAGEGVEPTVLAVSETTTTSPSPTTTPTAGPAPTTATNPAPPATTTTTSTTTTTTAPPSTTTTVAPSTTTTAPPAPPASAYVAIPKPAGGLNAIAPGGALTKHLAADIAAAFGFGQAEVEAAIDGVALPPEAGGNPEGWLAPGRYEPADGAIAGDIVQAMVDRRVAQLEARQLPRDQWDRVLTAASVIEKETYNQNEKPNVARVLANRLAGGGKLQMDSIILYPVPEDRIFTTAAERAANQPYNSYFHNGLPPTPIASPDEASIDAFLAPPPGDWWFYVTINLDTGETRFALSFAEHEENVKLLRAWQRDNPTP